ncbi:MAG: FtsX-like permease family protein [Chitinivibrionales bacterium]|nr:FtsX-like permease family protein [Chitinivibrionales bacterium]MBD3356387.1 FtsX-like permease family protein [Chitinivibrionales bacterium]
MTFYKVALCNLRRNPVRSILTGLSLAVAATTLSAVMSLDKGYTSAVTDDLVNKTGVHLYITKEGCPIEAASVIAQGGISPLYVEENIVDKISAMPELAAIMPFKLFALTTDDGMRTDIFMGVTEAVQTIKPDFNYVTGGWFTSDSSVILGAEMARVENLGVGDLMYSEHFQKEFVVSGILERNYSQDDGTFFIPLTTAQKLVNREGKLSAVALKLKDVGTMDASRNQIRAMMPADYYVIGSKELSEGILQFFGSTRVMMFVMVGVAFVISIFGIINTMLMAVLERRKEIAYLKCVGAGKRDLLRLISMETLSIAVIGSAVGTLGGVLLSPAFGAVMRRFIAAYLPSGSIAQPDVGIALLAFGVCTIIGLGCSLYPALRAARIVPMEVLRNE